MYWILAWIFFIDLIYICHFFHYTLFQIDKTNSKDFVVNDSEKQLVSKDESMPTTTTNSINPLNRTNTFSMAFKMAKETAFPSSGSIDGLYPNRQSSLISKVRSSLNDHSDVKQSDSSISTDTESRIGKKPSPLTRGLSRKITRFSIRPAEHDISEKSLIESSEESLRDENILLKSNSQDSSQSESLPIAKSLLANISRTTTKSNFTMPSVPESSSSSTNIKSSLEEQSKDSKDALPLMNEKRKIELLEHMEHIGDSRDSKTGLIKSKLSHSFSRDDDDSFENPPVSNESHSSFQSNSQDHKLHNADSDVSIRRILKHPFQKRFSLADAILSPHQRQDFDKSLPSKRENASQPDQFNTQQRLEKMQSFAKESNNHSRISSHSFHKIQSVVSIQSSNRRRSIYYDPYDSYSEAYSSEYDNREFSQENLSHVL